MRPITASRSRLKSAIWACCKMVSQLCIPTTVSLGGPVYTAVDCEFCSVCIMRESLHSFPELSFKAGDEVSVIGFQNGTGKWRPVSLPNFKQTKHKEGTPAIVHQRTLHMCPCTCTCRCTCVHAHACIFSCSNLRVS